MAPENKTTPLEDAEEKLEKGLALILSALPTLVIHWIKKKSSLPAGGHGSVASGTPNAPKENAREEAQAAPCASNCTTPPRNAG